MASPTHVGVRTLGAGRLAVLGALVWSASASGQCEMEFSSVGGGIIAGSAQINAMLVFDDDGPGPHAPALYVAGSSMSLPGVNGQCLARWDGTLWNSVGFGGQSAIHSLAAYDVDGDGPALPKLYAGGTFNSAGGTDARFIARWSGSQWSQVGMGMDGSVLALTPLDPDEGGPVGPRLYAGGEFLLANGKPASKAASWNSAFWQPLGSGLNGAVTSFAAFDEDGTGGQPAALFAGGQFVLAGGNAANRIARWSAGNWSALGAGMDGNVAAVCAVAAGPLGPKLYVGGEFAKAGGAAANKIAAWNGTGWSTLGSGMGPPGTRVAAVAPFAPAGEGSDPTALFAGGTFQTAGGKSAARLARWDGTTWIAVPGLIPDGEVRALTGFDEDGAGPGSPALFVAGTFSTTGPSGTRGIARLNFPQGEGPPNITVPPVPQDLYDGQTAVFSVGVSGGGYTVQWRRNLVPLQDGGKIVGSKTTTLVVKSISGSDAGSYDALVANACGEVQSPAAALTLLCFADCNGDGLLDADDFICYFERYQQGCP